MNISFELLQILDAIDRNGSFEAAAYELHKVRSALTYTVRKFEKNLDVIIFDRSKRKAKLTATGRLLLEQGRQLLNLNSQLERNIKLAATGWETILRIAYDEKVNIQPILTLIDRFQQECPPVHLELYTEVLGGCAEALGNKSADIAIGISVSLPTSSSLYFHPIGRSTFVFAVAPHHPLAKIKGSITQAMIKEFPLIVARDSAITIHSSIPDLLPELYRITVSSLEVKRQAQIAGLGIGFLPLNHIKEDVKAGRLVIKETEIAKQTSTTYIAWNKEKQGKALQWFIKHMKNKQFINKILC